MNRIDKAGCRLSPEWEMWRSDFNWKIPKERCWNEKRCEKSKGEASYKKFLKNTKRLPEGKSQKSLGSNINFGQGLTRSNLESARSVDGRRRRSEGHSRCFDVQRELRAPSASIALFNRMSQIHSTKSPLLNALKMCKMTGKQTLTHFVCVCVWGWGFFFK